MKTKNKILFNKIIPVMLLLAFVFAFPFMVAEKLVNAANTTAQEPLVRQTALLSEPEPDSSAPQFPTADLASGYEIPNTAAAGITCAWLYQNLLQLFNEMHSNDVGFVQQTVVNSNMFMRETQLTLNKNYQITSLSGLALLNLGQVETLNVAENKIKEITKTDLSGLTKLTTLIAYDNELETLDLTGCYYLTFLNANNNKLKAIDLRTISNGRALLGFNRFNSMESIRLPEIIASTSLELVLINNNITNADSYFTNEFYQGKLLLELGLQGVGFNFKANASLEEREVFLKVDKTKGIKFYNLQTFDVMVRIKERLTGVVTEITNSAEENIQNFYLPVGTYEVEYLDSTGTSDMYTDVDPIYCVFKPLARFDVIPSAPTAMFKIGNELKAETGKISGKAQLIIENTNGAGEIWHRVGRGQWVQGAEVELSAGGYYQVSFKVIEDEFESEIVSKFVHQDLNPYISDWLMIVLIVAIGLVLLFVVLPLIKKYALK